MSEPMPTIPTQSPFTYHIPNPSASPSFTQDDTSESFIPEPTQPMPTFTQTAFSQPAFSQPNQSIFSQPAVHFQQTQPTQTNQTEKEKYEIWAMKMEYWIQNADHNLWRIVQQGNSPKRLGKDAKGNTIVHPPVSLDEHVAVQRENKVRTLLLQALPEDHMPDFHHYDDARDIWMAVKARFGGNEESKKMRKTMLKQQFTEFSVTEEEGLHKGYDRFQKILSQLNQVQARPDNDDINLKFLRALPSSWSQVALALKTRGGLDSMSFDDLYNKLRSLELDVRIGHSYGVKAAAAPTHSAFIGAASSGPKLIYSDQQCIVPQISQTSGRSDNIMECLLHSFVAENEPDQDMIYEDFDQVDQLEMEELDLKWQMAMLSLRINRPDNDDINLKFLGALPSSWSQVALALKIRGGLESMSFDDVYNKLRSLELDVRFGHSYGVKADAAPTHSAFIGAASSGSKLTLRVFISRVEFSADEESLGKDASKQGRINAIDTDHDITLISVQHMNVSAAGDKVSTASAAIIVSAAITTATTVDEITLAQELKELKSTKPKQKGVVIQELGESTTTKTISS
ncbi:hypothetical protein Tco_1090884 [Tanacetum coccineum]|uniref:Uncharacterized protein n=1 Tax=Tanacetum coccineum TaxID=301880 RepID=A0ABQ5I6K5_9ASTR